MVYSNMNSFSSLLVVMSCIITVQIHCYTMTHQTPNSNVSGKMESRNESILEKENSTSFGRYKISKSKRHVSQKYCESGWHSFGEMCYKIEGMRGGGTKLSWDNAETFCVRKDGHLASIHSTEMNEFLKTLLSHRDEGSIYIGLRESPTEEGFGWTDETKMEFQNWAQNEPSKEHCVEMYFSSRHAHQGEWNDVKCDQSRPFICQKDKAPTVAGETDTTTETTLEKENSTSSSFEHYRTSKRKRAISGKSCESGWHAFGEMCYKIEGVRGGGGRRMLWEDAEKFCVGAGGHLVSIHSTEMNEFLKTILSDLDEGSAFIGLHEKQSGAPFEWTDETKVEFLNWARNEPSKEHCVEMYYSASHAFEGEWNDVDCAQSRPFICQKAKDNHCLPTMENSCNKNGVCEERTDKKGYKCKCNEMFSGKVCEHENHCLPTMENPCNNNGVCEERRDKKGYKCKCNEMSSGKVCEHVDGTDTKTPIAGIVGGIIGSVLVVLIVVATFKFGSCRRKAKDSEYVGLQEK